MRFQFNLKAILLLSGLVAVLAMMWPVYMDWSTPEVDWKAVIANPQPPPAFGCPPKQAIKELIIEVEGRDRIRRFSDGRRDLRPP